MKILLVFLVAIVCVSARQRPINVPTYGLPGRIVGGKPAVPHEFPFQLSLQYRKSHYCGATILNEHWVVTAALCLYGSGVNGFRIVAGAHNLSDETEVTRQVRNIRQIIVHPKYGGDSLANDISLLRLDTPLDLKNSAVRPIEIPAPSYQASGNATVIGWGVTEENGPRLSDVLLKVTVPIVTDEDCRAAYGKYNIEDSMICAGFSQGGADSCQGDSGGPLILACNDGAACLVGIVSWGIGCARPSYPGVYTEVSYFVDWINTYVH